MRRLTCLISLILTAAALGADTAWATQEHADPEGLYSHQIAHIFFMFSMLLLAFQVMRSRPLHEGWRFIGLASIAFFLWNLNVFTVHLIREYIGPELLRGPSGNWAQMLDISGPGAKVFYAGKILDHFFLSGALILFVLGLRKLVGKSGLWEEQ